MKWLILIYIARLRINKEEFELDPTIFQQSIAFSIQIVPK